MDRESVLLTALLMSQIVIRNDRCSVVSSVKTPGNTKSIVQYIAKLVEIQLALYNNILYSFFIENTKEHMTHREL